MNSEQGKPPPPQKRPLTRNPYFWAFLFGIIAIPAIRPLTRYIPDPPPVSGMLSDFQLVNHKGENLNLASLKNHVTILSFFSTQCGDEPCGQALEAPQALYARLQRAHLNDIRLLSIRIDPDNNSLTLLSKFVKKLNVDGDLWAFATGSTLMLEKLIQSISLSNPARNPVEGDDNFQHDKFVLIDGNGGIRGLYDFSEEGIDEVYHRAQHVFREQGLHSPTHDNP